MSPRAPAPKLRTLALGFVRDRLEAFLLDHVQQCEECNPYRWQRESHGSLHKEKGKFSISRLKRRIFRLFSKAKKDSYFQYHEAIGSDSDSSQKSIPANSLLVCDIILHTRRELEEALLPALCEELLEAVLSESKRFGNHYEGVHYAAFSLFFDKRVKKLTLRHSLGYVVLAPLAQSLADHGEGLESFQAEDHFGGRGAWTAALQVILWPPRQLRQLVLSVPCRLDEVLGAVGRSCHCLARLDVGGCLQDAAVYALLDLAFQRLCFLDPDEEEDIRRRNPCCETMEVLTLSDVEHERFQFNPVPASVVAMLLQVLLRLRGLPHYPYTGESIFNVYEKCVEMSVEPTQCRLEVVCDTWTKPERMRVIRALCPGVKELRLQNPQEGTLEELVELNGLQSLRLVELGRGGELAPTLRAMGSRLRCLEIVANFESRFGILAVDLWVVATQCPQLTRMVYSNVRLQLEDTDHPPAGFPALEELALKWTVPLTRDLVQRLLPLCPSLVRLSLFGSGVGLKDDDLSTLMATTSSPASTSSESPSSATTSSAPSEAPTPGFSQLEALWMDEGCQLTRRSARLLVDSCPRLCWLGELSQWAVSKQELRELKKEFLAHNYGVRLSWDDKTKGKDVYYYSMAGPIPIPRPLVIGDHDLP